ncbi:MAG: hypothetical protein OIN66_10605 [Candidatus Methanoperedens sp.]|nr:hypothetical protein [Candidatus Methanoperedens sp.]
MIIYYIGSSGYVTGHIKSAGIEIVDGPVGRQGAIGPIESFYVRDLGGNLTEILNCLSSIARYKYKEK